MKPTKNIVNNNSSKDKQTNISRISRISLLISPMSRLKKVDLTYFIFLFIFIFIFYLFFYFLFLEQLGLGLISHKVTTVT